MTRYIGLSLFASFFMLTIACHSSHPPQSPNEPKGHAMQADRSSTMAGSPHQTMDQTPNLPQIDLRALEKFTREEPQFKEHYGAHYANSGYGYNQYRPAYQYGYDLALDERYGRMSWSTLELQARKGWNEGTMGLWDRGPVRMGTGRDRSARIIEETNSSRRLARLSVTFLLPVAIWRSGDRCWTCSGRRFC